jgi:uncharacterized membrane protein
MAIGEGFLMKRLFCSSLLLAAVCALSSAAFAQSTYRMTLIDGDPTTPNRTTAVDLNDRGEVAGVISLDGGIRRSFLFRNGSSLDIGDLEGGTSPQFVTALAINNRGDIVGESLSTGASRPFIYSGGQIGELKGFASAIGVRPTDINNRRQVIGTVTLPTSDPFAPDVKFLQQGSSWTPLDPLPGYFEALVNSINDRGIVAGASTGPSSRATIWVEGRPEDLGDFPGLISSGARDINDFNDIVVSGVTANDEPRVFLWRRGKITELAGVGEPESQYFNRAESINNRRQIVGTQFQGDPQQEPTRIFAVLWESDGKAFDLNELISSDDPLKPFVTLSAGEVINNRGQILARGRDSRRPAPFAAASYLLTPLP